MPVVGLISQASKSLYFFSVQTDSGFLQELAVEVPEEHVTPGVDGRRWRTLYRQYPSFSMTTIGEAATFAVACANKNRAESLTNQLVSLSVTVGGVAYAFRNVHVESVRATAVPGTMVASGSSGGAAHLVSQWVLTFTDFNQSPQAGS